MDGSGEETLTHFKNRFPERVLEAQIRHPRLIAVKVKPDGFLECCRYLRDQLGFDHVPSISAVDWKTHLSVVYHLYSYSKRLMMELTVDLPRDNPRIASVTPLWGGANWHEREQYDFFGIIFEGHPNLERIMTPPGWQYYPLRKDRKVTGEVISHA